MEMIRITDKISERVNFCNWIWFYCCCNCLYAQLVVTTMESYGFAYDYALKHPLSTSPPWIHSSQLLAYQ